MIRGYRCHCPTPPPSTSPSPVPHPASPEFEMTWWRNKSPRWSSRRVLPTPQMPVIGVPLSACEDTQVGANWGIRGARGVLQRLAALFLCFSYSSKKLANPTHPHLPPFRVAFRLSAGPSPWRRCGFRTPQSRQRYPLKEWSWETMWQMCVPWAFYSPRFRQPTNALAG